MKFASSKCDLDSRDTHLGKNKLTLEGFSLSFASPNTQNERNLTKIDRWLESRVKHAIFIKIDGEFKNLDVGKGHEVLGDVNDQLVHESGSNVEAIQ